MTTPVLRVFIIVGNDKTPRAFAFVDQPLAKSCLGEADSTWPEARPHQVVPFVPETPEQVGVPS